MRVPVGCISLCVLSLFLILCVAKPCVLISCVLIKKTCTRFDFRSWIYMVQSLKKVGALQWSVVSCRPSWIQNGGHFHALVNILFSKHGHVVCQFSPKCVLVNVFICKLAKKTWFCQTSYITVRELSSQMEYQSLQRLHPKPYLVLTMIIVNEVIEN